MVSARDNKFQIPVLSALNSKFTKISINYFQAKPRLEKALFYVIIHCDWLSLFFKKNTMFLDPTRQTLYYVACDKMQHVTTTVFQCDSICNYLFLININ